ncbi:hypothetical protein H5410_042051 [Solanum commersonii]|uniref:Uncharacterized protein n=1 Tax=Solanum commersonii TaxID=4109 RepID=A0A9J5XTM7_SOLCO|nr:hypothetical protein H5410_042051 [Solanum commersonii]
MCSIVSSSGELQQKHSVGSTPKLDSFSLLKLLKGLQAHTKLQVSELQFSKWKKEKMIHMDQTTPNLQKDRNMMNQVSTHKANKDSP